jgi:hypothetical protein
MAVPLFAIFILLEAKIAAFPLIPARIVFERSVGFSYIVSSFGSTAYFASLYYVPLYLQVRITNLSAGHMEILTLTFRSLTISLLKMLVSA